jgi:hypothetical protein
MTSFDPGAADFGMYSQWPTFPGRTVYSENALNTFDLPTTQKHLVFPLRDMTGAIVPNAYLVGIEESANNDFQDLVYIIRNVSATTGDFNANGAVDGNDFLAWQRGLGTTVGATRAMGNADFDADVDAADLGVWRQQFGVTTAAVVPAIEAALAPAVVAGGIEVASLGLGSSPATDLIDLAITSDASAAPSRRTAGVRPSERGEFAWDAAAGDEARMSANPALAPGDALSAESDDGASDVDLAFEALGAALYADDAAGFGELL